MALRAITDFRDIDKGMANIMSTMKELNGVTIKVGILENSSKMRYKSGVSLVEVAVKNEFGIGVPERSFLRSTFDNNEKQWNRKIARILQKRLFSYGHLRVAAIQIGRMIQQSVQSTIVVMKSPPNSARTIANKGANDPLIHTRRLLQNIKYNVDFGGKMGN